MLATPVDGTFVEVVLVTQVREIRKPGRLIVGLGFLPMRRPAEEPASRRPAEKNGT